MSIWTELQEEVGDALGFTRTSAKWAVENRQAIIDSRIQEGVKQFYTNPRGHEWSFLRPTTTLPTVASTGEYDLAATHANIEGPMVIQDPVSVYFSRIDLTTEGRIEELRIKQAAENRPKLAAIRPKTSDGSAEQLWEILFWPVPNAIYTVHYRYHAIPAALTTNDPFPLGGPVHLEAIRKSCIAAAELYRDRQHGGQYEAFLVSLDASVAHDIAVSAPDIFGKLSAGNFNVTPRQRRVTQVNYGV